MWACPTLLEKNEPRTERAALASAAHEREALDARGLARSPRHGMDLNEPEPMEPQHLTTSDATYVVAVAESDDEEDEVQEVGQDESMSLAADPMMPMTTDPATSALPATQYHCMQPSVAAGTGAAQAAAAAVSAAAAPPLDAAPVAPARPSAPAAPAAPQEASDDAEEPVDEEAAAAAAAEAAAAAAAAEAAAREAAADAAEAAVGRKSRRGTAGKRSAPTFAEELTDYRIKAVKRARQVKEGAAPLPKEAAPAGPDSEWIQCDLCQKWRIVKVCEIDAMDPDSPWICSMNSDVRHNSCSAQQRLWLSHAPTDGERIQPRGLTSLATLDKHARMITHAEVHSLQERLPASMQDAGWVVLPSGGTFASHRLDYAFIDLERNRRAEQERAASVIKAEAKAAAAAAAKAQKARDKGKKGKSKAAGGGGAGGKGAAALPASLPPSASDSISALEIAQVKEVPYFWDRQAMISWWEQRLHDALTRDTVQKRAATKAVTGVDDATAPISAVVTLGGGPPAGGGQQLPGEERAVARRRRRRRRSRTSRWSLTVCGSGCSRTQSSHALEGVGGREAERRCTGRGRRRWRRRRGWQRRRRRRRWRRGGGGRLFVGLADAAAAGTAARAGRPQAQRARGGSQRERARRVPASPRVPAGIADARDAEQDGARTAHERGHGRRPRLQRERRCQEPPLKGPPRRALDRLARGAIGLGDLGLGLADIDGGGLVVNLRLLARRFLRLVSHHRRRCSPLLLGLRRRLCPRRLRRRLLRHVGAATVVFRGRRAIDHLGGLLWRRRGSNHARRRL